MYKECLPIVHINGTSKSVLVDERLLVKRKLEEALQLLLDASPNGRDYYPEPGRLGKATKVWKGRIDMIEALIGELYDEAIQIDGAG